MRSYVRYQPLRYLSDKFRECEVEDCELCGLSSQRCLSCKERKIGQNNICLKATNTCAQEQCQSCSLTEKIGNFKAKSETNMHETVQNFKLDNFNQGTVILSDNGLETAYLDNIKPMGGLSSFKQRLSLKETTNSICLKCKDGYSLSPELLCVEAISGCRIYDTKSKTCIQCLFNWYVNSQFECSKGKSSLSSKYSSFPLKLVILF